MRKIVCARFGPMKRAVLLGVLVALVAAMPAEARGLTVKRAHGEVAAYSDSLIEAGGGALTIRHCHYRAWHRIVRCRVLEPDLAFTIGAGGPSYVLRVTSRGVLDEGTGETVW